MNELRSYLSKLSPGPIEDTGEVESFLYDCWDEFISSDAEAMNCDKLGRMEDVSWNPPVLTFDIERHGGTVQGSSRAEIHQWDVNVESMNAFCSTGRLKQLTPRQPGLDVKPLVAEIAGLIIGSVDDERVKQNSNGSVRVQIGKIIPDDGPKETVQGRRKRFRLGLEELLQAKGWQSLRPNVYALREVDK
jgi:hypothetical protein